MVTLYGTLAIGVMGLACWLAHRADMRRLDREEKEILDLFDEIERRKEDGI